MFLRSLARRVVPTATTARALHVSRTASTAEGLRSILKEELQVEKEEGVAPTLSSEIRGFKVNYNPGKPVLNLTNVVDGDLVNLRINLNDCDIPEAPVYEEEQEEEKEEMFAPRPVFAINVTNEAKGKTLMFNAFLEAENLIITRMGVKATSVSTEDEYENVYFTDFQHLDERVQEETANYLASKGIGAELCREVEGLVADAEYNEYLRWLTDTTEFLE